jgi:hypothetical protein
MPSFRSALAIAALPAVLLVGCSKTDTASTTTTTAAPSCNSDVATLKKSLADLTSINVIKEGTTALNKQIDTVKTDLATVKASAKSSASAQIDTLDSSITNLKTAIDDAGSGGLSVTSAANIVKAVTETGTAGKALVTELDAACK